MRTKLKTMLLAALIVNPLATFAMTDIPTCPTSEALKQVPFVAAQIDYWLGWIAISPASKYDTPMEWTKIMIIGNIDHDVDEAFAVKKANNALPDITGNAAGPEKSDNAYWCGYPDKDHNTSILAVTPAYESLGKKLAKLQRYSSF